MDASSDIEQAKLAVQQGDKERARGLLAGLVQRDPNNAQAWLLLADQLDDPKQATYCRERASKIMRENPPAPTRQAPKPPPMSMPPNAPPTPSAPGPQFAHTPSKQTQELPRRKWYQSPGCLILSFLFFTPLWSVIVLDDRRQRTSVKVVAGTLLVIYVVVLCFLSWVAYNSGVFRTSSGVVPAPLPAQKYVKVEQFKCDLAGADRGWRMRFYGVVRNVGDRRVGVVTVRGDVIREGQLVVSGTGKTSTDILWPDATANFDFYLDLPAAHGYDCSVSIEDAYFSK